MRVKKRKEVDDNIKEDKGTKNKDDLNSRNY